MISFVLEITVRFEKTEYNTSESDGYVEVCTVLNVPLEIDLTTLNFNLTVSLGFSQGELTLCQYNYKQWLLSLSNTG